MTSTIASRRDHTGTRLVRGFHHLELWVGNARSFAHLLQSGFGFVRVGYAGPETGRDGAVSYLLRQGDIRLLVSAGLDDDAAISRHAARHGDGVRSIALSVDDVVRSLGEILSRGGEVDLGDLGASVPPRLAAVVAYGETRIELVEADAAEHDIWPLMSGDDLVRVETGRPVGLERIDHVVANVEEGLLDEWVAWHESVLGLTEMRHFDADQISTEYSALRSTVVWNGEGVVLPINEPAQGRRTSQIEEFLDAYHGPGVQHIALASPDIVGTVAELRRRGIGFLAPPPSYYDEARRRVGDIELPWARLEELGILVDVERGGYLLQVFTDTIGDRPTLFFEIIERRGATGFGEGNFKALFEAIEREQERRGHLGPRP